MRNEFRKMKGLKLSYERQGMIFFTLRNYEIQTEKIKGKIDQKIREAARGEIHTEQALREWCILGESVIESALRHNIDATALYRARKRLYESW